MGDRNPSNRDASGASASKNWPASPSQPLGMPRWLAQQCCWHTALLFELQNEIVLSSASLSRNLSVWARVLAPAAGQGLREGFRVNDSVFLQDYLHFLTSGRYQGSSTISFAVQHSCKHMEKSISVGIKRLPRSNLHFSKGWGRGGKLLWCCSLEQQFWELGFGFHSA